jgi:hypothetical protein
MRLADARTAADDELADDGLHGAPSTRLVRLASPSKLVVSPSGILASPSAVRGEGCARSGACSARAQASQRETPTLTVTLTLSPRCWRSVS